MKEDRELNRSKKELKEGRKEGREGGREGGKIKKSREKGKDGDVSQLCDSSTIDNNLHQQAILLYGQRDGHISMQ